MRERNDARESRSRSSSVVSITPPSNRGPPLPSWNRLTWSLCSYGTDEKALASLYTVIHFLRSIPTLFLLRHTSFSTEPGMRTERNGTEKRKRRRQSRTPRFLEDCMSPSRSRIASMSKAKTARHYKKLGGRCQHMDGNATRGREGGSEEAHAHGGSLALRRNRAAARRRRRRGLRARARALTRENPPVCTAVGQCP